MERGRERGRELKCHLLSWDINLKPGRFSSVHGCCSLQRQRKRTTDTFNRVKAESPASKVEKERRHRKSVFLLLFGLEERERENRENTYSTLGKFNGKKYKW